MSNPVNTTTDVPKVPGTYNSDGIAPGMYCTVKDVFTAGIGIRWEEIQEELDRYRVMVHDDAPDVPSLITNHLIPEAESEVDEWLKMTYKPTVVTKRFDGNGTNMIMLPFYPVTQLNRITVYATATVRIIDLVHPGYITSLGDVNGLLIYENIDTLVESETGIITIPPRAFNASGFPLWTWNFTKGDRNIEVCWQHGFDSYDCVPQSFRRAVATRVAIKCLEITGVIEYRGMSQTEVGPSKRMVGREKNLPYGDVIGRMETAMYRTLTGFKRVG